jgi:hypothetical protein
MSFHLKQNIDFKKHNEEVCRVMEAYNSGKPYRVPVMVSGSITNYFLNPELNTKRLMFKDFFENPDVQINTQLEYQKWKLFNVCCDLPMGLPDDSWQLSIDFQNSWEATWFGCPLIYWDWRVPDSIEILKENGELLYDMPETLDYKNGIISRIIEFYDYMCDKCKNMEYHGRLVKPPVEILGERTDGIFTLATKVRGTENLLVDMLTNEKYYHDLMDYLTSNIINRIKKIKEYRWSKNPDAPDKGVYRYQNMLFADDSIMLLSSEQYKEYVYPYHKRFFDELGSGSPALFHLCGDATRHFKFIKENLNVDKFDTGFPVDHGWLRKELGHNVTIYGGPTIMTLKDGSFKEIEREVERVCKSGVMEGGKFILIAANNMAPSTSVENVVCMYEAGKKYGVYQ